MKMAILGAGNIARKMATTIVQMEGIEAYAVASRDLAKAQDFAKKWSILKAFGSYEEMLEDKEVELVYVCTPHIFHFQHMMLCLEHGKHVICEKPFTVNADEAKKIFSYAEEHKLFATEAIWTRYLPMRLVLDQILERRVIGDPQSLTANLCYPLKTVPRMRELALAGGALLDLGVYTINFAMMVFGNDIDRITSTCTKLETGVDANDSITMTFKNGNMALLHSSMLCNSDRRGMIFGSKGYIEFLNINNCEGINVYDLDYHLIENYKPFKYITGFEHEVEASQLAIAEGKLECKQMPHSETIRVMEIMDEVRKEWGLRYPRE
ncbi:Gfo/Idh/MocA family oxidoreductase [uncultured Sphaerochaeta sp.]|uniref:Gfo/Idh/MocA family protein n=1 Tax=uncultured Sphaerochaeta sp. TaxID=886478 RepID=UPI002A0A4180|nr:Gfo/Idh/MocA family oxidoreductase [uncultured Sphaerochaeta sp.]